MRRADGSLWVAARHGHGIEQYHVAQGSTNDCGPHAVATAINFCLGAPVIDARALAREMNRPRLQAGFPPVVIRRIPNWATLPWGMADMLRQHGLNTRWRALAHEGDLLAGLEADRVLLPIFGEPLRRRGLRPAGWSHVAILAGWNPAGGVYWFIDSAHRNAPAGKARRVFLREWTNMGRLLVEVA